ncbi:monoacylglycerol lipase abhd6-like [Plakobranchus ocellatus]|uniref:acylglycerol lipase n=1 Tax=Plakobranchus ocellatus TaxID=259542 RepID=A0AAV4AJJ7_9GAST|nr:monoacylglycerol lipase abhd6-like [Plakobranchus ocellatus]
MGFWTAVAAVVFALIAAPIGGFILLFYCFPHVLVKQFMRYQAYKSGMTIKFVGNEEKVFCYGEKNKQQPNKASIVFLHGFTSSKDQWISCFNRLPADIHMIAVDLPGHGDSSRPDEDGDLSFDRAAELVNEFLHLVNLDGKKVHLVGSSLGGAIAGIFAAKYPEMLDRVSMICPAVQTPVDTHLQLQIKKAASKATEEVSYEDCLLLTDSLQDIKDMLLGICFSKDLVKFHDQIFKGFLTLRLPKLPYFLRLFSSLTTVNKLDYLEKVAHRITVPSQLIWGKNDEVLHVSGVDVLQPKLGDCHHVDLIDRCGHAIHIDRPGALAKYILKFYQEGENGKKD